MNYKEKVLVFYKKYYAGDNASVGTRLTIKTLERRAAAEGLNPDNFLIYRDAKNY